MCKSATAGRRKLLALTLILACPSWQPRKDAEPNHSPKLDYKDWQQYPVENVSFEKLK